MRKLFLALSIFAMLLAPALPVAASGLDAAVANTAAYVQKTVRNPEPGSAGGEWTVLGLARSNRAVPDSYFTRYLAKAERYVREKNGVLHEKMLTEYSRMVLGLTAAGFDPRDVAGFDLTLPLGDFERVIWQGINGPVFALLALDSLDYPVPDNADAGTQATREMYVTEILRRQTSDGGWNLTAGSSGEVSGDEKGDPEITGIVLQALAKYRDNADVAAAVTKALTFLSFSQGEGGGFSSPSSPEASAQVLVALCELGIPVSDSRFVKKGNSVLDSLLSFRNGDGGFRRTRENGESNLMATEQALYALVAAQRASERQNSLYRMSDRTER